MYVDVYMDERRGEEMGKREEDGTGREEEGMY